MNAKKKKFFSFSISQTAERIDNRNVIEIINCPLKEMMCKVHLTDIYKNYVQSEFYRKEKEYLKSINCLEIAFKKATELMDNPCNECAQQLRLCVNNSMDIIHTELEEVSKGIFGDKSYHSLYLKSVEMLTEFKNAKHMNTIKLHETKQRFLGNFLN